MCRHRFWDEENDGFSCSLNGDGCLGDEEPRECPLQKELHSNCPECACFEHEANPLMENALGRVWCPAGHCWQNRSDAEHDQQWYASIEEAV